jgi:sortase A
VLARHHQREAISALLRSWDTNAPSVTRDGIAVDGIVRIPRFGPTYAVPIAEGTGSRSLEIGVGHVPGSARPGAVGNLVLAGHRVTHGEPFHSLPSLELGDEVIIETLTSGYVYRVVSGASASLRVPDTSTWVLASAPSDPARPGVAPAGRRLITLITCAELFHTSDRLVVFGELVRTYPRVRPHPEA